MKVAHLADIHLGFRQYHRLAGINQREADVADAFRAVIDQVIKAGPTPCSLRVTSSCGPSRNAAIIFAFRQFQRLREALPEVPVVVIAGNHDTPPVLGDRLDPTALRGAGRRDRARCAAPFLLAFARLSVLAVPPPRAARGETCIRKTEPNQVLLLHGEVEGVYPGDVWCVGWCRGLARSLHAREWTWVALGHYLQHEVERASGTPGPSITRRPIPG